MKKIAVNNTQTTVILASGRLELAPKGAANKKDRKEISAELAEHPDVVRFADQMKISLLSMEDAGLKEHKESAKTPAAPVVPSPESKVEEKEKPAAEDKPLVEKRPEDEDKPAADDKNFKPEAEEKPVVEDKPVVADEPAAMHTDFRPDDLPSEDLLPPEPKEDAEPEEEAKPSADTKGKKSSKKRRKK